MTGLNIKQNKNALKSGTLTVILASSAMLCATTLPAYSQVHKPLIGDGPLGNHEALLGEPKGSEVAHAVEQIILEGELGDALDGDVSDGAREAARLAYAQSVFAPLWTREAAETLMKVNPTCLDHGFDTGMTDDQLRAAIDARFSGTAEQRAKADLDLTATWLVLASRMSGGLSDEGGMVRSNDTRPTRSDLVQALLRASTDNPVSEMERFAALSPQYDKLKGALKRYRQYSDAGGWMKIPAGEEMLEPGMDDPRVPALRLRMEAEGFAPPRRYAMLEVIDLKPAEDTLYDDSLVAQVKNFQAVHGLEQDGVLGPATLTALNESVDSKIDRIERTMDYWRSNPNPGDQHIWVNIPSYRVEAWNNGQMDLSMKTIVGKSYTPTPAFSDEVEYVVVNPKWFLPIGLFKRQKLRKLKNDPSYASRYNYTIYDRASGETLDPFTVNWSDPDVASRVQMVQDSGPNNALGQLKIIFPNRHSVYLHDTPDDHLFEKGVRALSSGCIRLEDPVAMANWITDHDAAVDTSVFNATLESRQRDRFHLDHHVKVHLTYLPATVMPDGRVEFPADIYRKFKTPALANGTYPDDIAPEGNSDQQLVVEGGSPGSVTLTGKATLQ